jgi:hypothetical protein
MGDYDSVTFIDDGELLPGRVQIARGVFEHLRFGFAAVALDVERRTLALATWQK